MHGQFACGFGVPAAQGMCLFGVTRQSMLWKSLLAKSCRLSRHCFHLFSYCFVLFSIPLVRMKSDEVKPARDASCAVDRLIAYSSG